MNGMQILQNLIIWHIKKLSPASRMQLHCYNRQVLHDEFSEWKLKEFSLFVKLSFSDPNLVRMIKLQLLYNLDGKLLCCLRQQYRQQRLG